MAGGDFAIEDRFRIEATLLRADGERLTHACLNEVVVARGTRVRMIQVEVEVLPAAHLLRCWVCLGAAAIGTEGKQAQQGQTRKRQTGSKRHKQWENGRKKRKPKP